MMEGKELGFVRANAKAKAPPSFKEQLARKTLRNVRLQGHTYVDLREDGKRFIFFCTLCLSPCYSDAVLFEHLKGNLHKERFLSAKGTLMRSNPWPFDDGVLFFRSDCDEVEEVKGLGSGRIELLGEREDCSGSGGGDLAIVVHNGPSKDGGNGNGNHREDEDDDEDMDGGEVGLGYDVVIPGVIGKEEICDLGVKLMGYGQISARFCEKDGNRTSMRRIWCEWLGKRSGDDDDDDGEDAILAKVPSHDFAIVSFGYFYDLGKQGLFEDMKTLLLTGGEGFDDLSGPVKRRKRSSSDTEDASEASSYQCDSSGEDSPGSTTTTSTSSALMLHRYDPQVLHSKIMSSKTLRRELRRQQRIASEKMCDICQHKMLPGKDVATLLNLKTGRLACSSRNVHGAFHVFHTSCLIHWILFCESEMFMKPPKVRRRSKRKTKWKGNQVENESGANVNGVKHNQSRKESAAAMLSNQICSVFCPDCQGTGVEIEGDELEKPTILLSQIFKYKIKLSEAHRAWMKTPEELENCSTGFGFHIPSDDGQEKVAPLKLVRFYRAEEDSWP